MSSIQIANKISKKILIIIISVIVILSLGIGLIICFNNKETSVDIKYDISDEDRKLLNINDATSTIIMDNSNNYVEINEGGKYLISGSCDDGYIYVEAKKEIVYLLLNNLTLSSSTSSCIIIENAKKVYISALSNTENILTDGSIEFSYTNEDSESSIAKGCIYSKDDLTINGNGKLVVNGNYRHAIVCNDTLTVVSTTLTLTSVEDGINDNMGFQTEDATIEITSGGNGIYSVNSDALEDNFTTIVSGSIKIDSMKDAIQSSGILGIIDGNIDIITDQATYSANSRKGLKSDNNIIIKNGTITIDTLDHAVRSNKNIYVYKGTLTLKGDTGLKSDDDVCVYDGVINITSIGDGINTVDMLKIENGEIVINSSDDGLHSDNEIIIEDGKVNINRSVEGIEAIEITIKGGEVFVNSSDDGINVNCVESGMFGMMGPTNSSNKASSGFLEISGGTVYVNATGDGLDSNDKIIISGGIVIVDGPTNSANGALDYASSCKISGGILIAVGASGMAQAPSGGSQCSTMINTGTKSAGTTFLITDEDGKLVLAYTPTKSYSSIVISSSKIKTNKTYNLYFNSQIDGTSINGLYQEGSIILQGTLYKSYTQTSKVTNVGSTSNNSPGGMQPGGPGGRW